MRTLKELFIILRDYKLQQNDWRKGICIDIDNLYGANSFTIEEKDVLHEFFEKQKPGLFSLEFYNRSFNTFNEDNGKFWKNYWWTRDEAGFVRRIKFLNKIIDSL